MYAVVLIPDFELQCAVRAEPELDPAAVALLDEATGATAPVVLQVNVAAQRAGVSVGMSVPQAQARCAELVFRRRNARQEKVATDTLLQSGERASPYLESTFPGCCTLDLRRHGELDHAAWAAALVRELQALRLQAQVGFAPRPDAALQAAQIARPVLLTTDARESMSALPVMVLDPSEPVLDVLFDWGIQRVADLRALDRQQVAERLGVEGLALWDRAGGGDLRPLRLVRAAEIYEETAEFEGGVETLEPVLFRLRRALEQLTRRLRTDLLLAGSIDFALDLDNGTELKHTICIPAPTCEVDTLFRVISTYLDTIRTDAPVKGLCLQVHPSMPRDHQTHLWEGSLRNPNGFSETLARLAAIVGADRIGVPGRLPTHQPDCFRLSAPDFDGRERPLAAQPGAFPPLGLSLRRYRPPRQVMLETEDGQLARLETPGVAGRIKACAGPWRLDGEWWDGQIAWGWEEWDVELTTGELFRLANHRREHWWMLGVYD